jgi:aldehyde dehydrogenase (NAD+)
MRYVKRFFEEIHAMYWFYPSEQFYAKLDRTLENGGAGESASWLCSLYSIFALGCMSESGVAQGRGMAVDSHSSTDYLALAKELMSRVVDEADVESVRAFGLLVCLPARTFISNCI